MWSRLRATRESLTHLPLLLTALLATLREQNALLRELIHVHSGSPADTPETPAPALPPALTARDDRIPLRRTGVRTGADVFVQTRTELLHRQQEADAAAWRAAQAEQRIR